MQRPLDEAEHAETPPEPQRRPKPTARDVVLGTAVAALVAFGVVVLAILSFDVNPAGPVVVVVGAIACGSLSMRHMHEYALKAATVGLVVGGIAAILLWPFFNVG